MDRWGHVRQQISLQLPRDLQLHPVSDEPIHADFVYVSKGASVTVEVPVLFLFGIALLQ